MSKNDPKKAKPADDEVVDQMAKDEAAEEKRVASLKGVEVPIMDKNARTPVQTVTALATNLTQKAIDRLNDLVNDLKAEISKGDIDIDNYKKRLKKAGNSLRRAGVALDVAGGDTGENAKEAAQDRWKKQKLFEDEVTYLKSQAVAARSTLEKARQSIEQGLPADALKAIKDQVNAANQDLVGPRSILAKVKGYVIPKIDGQFKKISPKEDRVGRVQTALDRAITETGDAVAYCDNNGDNPDFQQYAEHLDDAMYAIAEANFALDNLIASPQKDDAKVAPAAKKPAKPADSKDSKPAGKN